MRDAKEIAAELFDNWSNDPRGADARLVNEIATAIREARAEAYKEAADECRARSKSFRDRGLSMNNAEARVLYETHADEAQCCAEKIDALAKFAQEARNAEG